MINAEVIQLTIFTIYTLWGLPRLLLRVTHIFAQTYIFKVQGLKIKLVMSLSALLLGFDV